MKEPQKKEKQKQGCNTTFLSDCNSRGEHKQQQQASLPQAMIEIRTTSKATSNTKRSRIESEKGRVKPRTALICKIAGTSTSRQK